MYSPKHPKEDLFILSLYAEEAFGCMEWSYLYSVLEKFEFGAKLISCVKLLYSNPSARILINQTVSDPFNQ